MASAFATAAAFAVGSQAGWTGVRALAKAAAAVEALEAGGTATAARIGAGEVGAGAEGVALAGEHEGTDIVVLGGARDHGAQGLNRGVVDGVHDFGAVKGGGENAVVVEFGADQISQRWWPPGRSVARARERKAGVAGRDHGRRSGRLRGYLYSAEMR